MTTIAMQHAAQLRRMGLHDIADVLEKEHRERIAAESVLANIRDHFKPVRRGRWSHEGQCSECNQIDPTKPNYCPGCGAEMKSEVADDE